MVGAALMPSPPLFPARQENFLVALKFVRKLLAERCGPFVEWFQSHRYPAHIDRIWLVDRPGYERPIRSADMLRTVSLGLSLLHQDAIGEERHHE